MEITVSTIFSVIEQEGAKAKEIMLHSLIEEAKRISNRRHTRFNKEDVNRMTVDELVDIIVEEAALVALCREKADSIYKAIMADFNAEMNLLTIHAPVNTKAQEGISKSLQNIYDKYKGRFNNAKQETKGALLTILRERASVLLNV